ncbi:MAG: YegP family protein [Microcella sp.]
MKFEIVKGKSEKQPYFWRIVSANGQTLAVSENYVQKSSAKSAVESVMKNAGGATIVDLT